MVIGMYCAISDRTCNGSGSNPVGLCSFSNETITAAEGICRKVCVRGKSVMDLRSVTDVVFSFCRSRDRRDECDGKKRCTSDVGIQAVM